MSASTSLRTLVQIDVDYPGSDSETTPLTIELVDDGMLRISERGTEPDEDFEGMFALAPAADILRAIHRLDARLFAGVAGELGFDPR